MNRDALYLIVSLLTMTSCVATAQPLAFTAPSAPRSRMASHVASISALGYTKLHGRGRTTAIGLRVR